MGLSEQKNNDFSERSRSLHTLPDGQMARLRIGQSPLTVEVAASPASQTKGLSERDAIGSDGMLFVFSQPNYYKFWMKNMRFDLDFVWIADVVVVDITPNVPRPDDSDFLPTFGPPVPVDAMLEVPAGYAQQQGWAVGAAVSLE